MLPLLHPDNQEHLLAFAETVPDPLPELAYPSSINLRPDVSYKEDDRLLVDIEDGLVEFTISIANPGTNINQPNVICLRNLDQVPCTLDVDVWEVWLQPSTLAIVPIKIAAQPGDQLSFLLVPPNEYKRVLIASQMLYAFAEQYPDEPNQFVTLPPASQPVFDSCDFNLLLPDVSPADSYRLPTYYMLTERVPLQFLLKLCEPETPFYVNLVAFADRKRVVKPPSDVWNQPVELSHEAMIIPIDTDFFDAETFQIALIPHGSTLDAYALRHFDYSFEVMLPPSP